MKKEDGNEVEEDTAASVPLTEEQIIKIVNAAATNHAKRSAKQLDDKLASVVSQLEEMAAAKTAPTPERGESSDEDDRVKAMTAKLKKMEDAVAQREQQLREQETQRRTSTARTLLKDTLAEAGVPADRLKQAVGYLFDAEKRVEYSEDGTIEFLIPETGYVDRLDITNGVKKFLDSSEGKMYLPAREVSGSGNQGGKPPQTRTSAPAGDSLEDLSAAELLSELGKAMIGQ
ncbi:MAG: hypothetical protein GY814_04065 [Gammaproteobacteria bacterium]|nr:hypothetical protein [Gammaproteobacteria bacterium]